MCHLAHTTCAKGDSKISAPIFQSAYSSYYVMTNSITLTTLVLCCARTNYVRAHVRTYLYVRTYARANYARAYMRKLTCACCIRMHAVRMQRCICIQRMHVQRVTRRVNIFFYFTSPVTAGASDLVPEREAPRKGAFKRRGARRLRR